MKRTVKTRGGRHAAAATLAKAVKPAARAIASAEHDAEISRLRRLNSLVRWVAGSNAPPPKRKKPSPAPVQPANGKQLSDAIESITEGFALWDADDRLILCNSRFRAFYPAVSASLVPGASYERVLREAADKGQFRVDGPAEDWLQRCLHAHRARGGTREEELSDGRWLLATEHPTSDGGRVCIRGDITQRKQAEQAVRRSRATLQSMIDAVDDLIAMVNADGVILAINRAGAQGFGRQPRDLVGRSLLDQFDPDPAARLRGVIAAVMESRGRTQVEFAWQDRCLSLGAHAVLDGDGVPSAVSIFSRDITERVRAEEEARDHQHQLMRYMRIATMGEMSAALAHELNQPIAAIVNYCNGSLRRLASGRWTVDDLAEAVNETYAEAKRARDIIRNVSRFVRKAPRQRAVTDVGALVGAVVNLVRKDVERQGIEIVVRLDNPAVELNVNAVEVEQTLLNLLRNGIESIAGTSGSIHRIELRSRVEGRELHIGVHDGGTGFTPDAAARAFDPFFTTKAEGMGMGLAICRTIVEEHGGRIWAEPGPPLADGAAGIHLILPIHGVNNAAA